MDAEQVNFDASVEKYYARYELTSMKERNK